MKNNCTLLLKKHNFILSILNGREKKNAMFVGGCVRDFLLSGKISDDIDISTILKPDEVIEKLKKYARTHNKTKCIILDRDKKYGTIVAIINGARYEITTTRSDVNCFGRQAKVLFCDSFLEDSNRRDFTINALYADIDGNIFDFQNGLDDLKRGVVRFIGNPKQRIEEDFLRIIRFFRFATKLNFFSFNEDVLDIFKKTKYGLKQISRERIRHEIFILLEYKNWFNGLRAITDCDLVEDIFLLKKTSINRKKPSFVCNKIVELFYFFNFNLNTLNELKMSLLFTKNECKFVDFLYSLWRLTNEGKVFNIEVKMFLFYARKDFIQDSLPLFFGDILKQIKLFLLNFKPLKIDTNKLMKAGFYGKQLGDKIKQIERQWVESNFLYSNYF